MQTKTTTQPSDVFAAIVVTAKVMGHEIAPDVAEDMALELKGESPAGILQALRRCKRELSGRLTLAAVLERMPGGHPGGNEAWAMCPRSEAVTVVWTEEMQLAFGVAEPLLQQGDEIGARVAFLEKYKALLGEANATGAKPKWSPSLGHDASQRADVLREAARLGRLPAAYVERMLPPGQGLDPYSLPPGKTATLLADVLEKFNPAKVKA